jgi:hypothetical protein
MALGHRSETLPLFSLVGVSSVESWDTMLTIVLREECRPLGGIIVTGLDSHLHSLALHKLLTREANRTICMTGLIMYLWSKAQNDYSVVLGMFPVNSIPATVLFDSGASHSFITDQFVTKHNLSMSTMKIPLIVSSPGGEMKNGYICPRVNINIMGVDFLANLVVLKSWGIDVILGMDWLQSCDGVIQCQK